MQINIGDKSLMMILLLEECNLTCAHCSREDEPMEPGYRLSFRQLQLCLSDCHRLNTVNWVHFSGGEPTLWTEGNRALADVLLEVAKAGFIPGFTSNGSFFTDYGRCENFFKMYVDGSNMPLRLYLSIDTFHRNFDRETGRAPSLDNVIRCRRELPAEKANLIHITAMAVISKNSKSLLPDEMVEHYESQGVTFGFVPLHRAGKAKKFSHLCPDLSHDNPDGLGAFQRYYREGGWMKRNELKRRGRTDHIILIGNDYFFSDPWQKVGRLGRLPDEITRAYT